MFYNFFFNCRQYDFSGEKSTEIVKIKTCLDLYRKTALLSFDYRQIDLRSFFFVVFQPTILCFIQFASSHNIKMPAIRLTNNKVQILNPVLTRSPRSTLPKYDTVIGIHQASGIRHQPIDIHPIIIKIFAAVCKPDRLLTASGFPIPSTAHPHFGQTTASSSNSFPHFEQYFINTSAIALKGFVVYIILC